LLGKQSKTGLMYCLLSRLKMVEGYLFAPRLD
jgi:hypothetical protein